MVGWVVQEARGDGVALVAGYADDEEGFGGGHYGDACVV